MSKKKLIFGLILIFVGFLLLMRTLDLLFISFGEIFTFFIPVAFIVVGVWLIFRKKKQEDIQQIHSHQSHFTHEPHTSSSAHPDTIYQAQASFTSKSSSATSAAAEEVKYSEAPSGISPEGKTRYSKAFGDLYIDCKDMNLVNVEISSGFGDVDIKVHGGKLAEGLNRLVISGFVGDIQVLIPQDMEVFVHCSNFIGDTEALGKRATGFSNNLDAYTANYNTAERKLYIAANSFLGDIKVLVV